MLKMKQKLKPHQKKRYFSDVLFLEHALLIF